jgi:hypothetical protein
MVDYLQAHESEWHKKSRFDAVFIMERHEKGIAPLFGFQLIFCLSFMA